jgi:sugar lactone lactonase YvrE
VTRSREKARHRAPEKVGCYRGDSCTNTLAACGNRCQQIAVSGKYVLYYIGLDVHEKTITYCVKDVTGQIQQQEMMGQANFNIGRKCSGGRTASTICDPNSAAFDANGNVWVADTDGDRILRFSAPFTNDMPADLVIGQRDLTNSICGVDAQTLCHPRDVGFDAFGNLWVVDSGNNRVLLFLAPLSNSEAACLVIGQRDFTSKHCNRLSDKPAADTLCGPKGMALDSSGNLWVAEDDNSRVLEYDNPLHSGSRDISANLVYGEPDFSTVACAVGANSVCHPDHVAIGRFGQLIISDSDNNRLLVVNSPLSNTTANAVIGQPNFTSGAPATNANGFAGPKGITVDSTGNLYVTGEDNNRP